MGTFLNKAKVLGTSLLKYLKYLLYTAFLLFFLFLALLFIGHYLVQQPRVQRAILDQITVDRDYAIKTGELKLNIWHGFGVLIDNLEINSKISPDFIKIKKTRIILDKRQLIKRHLKPTDIYLYQPQMQTSRSLNPLSSRPDQETVGIFSLPLLPHSIPSISIVDGTFRHPDSGVQVKAIDFSIALNGDNQMSRMIQGHGIIHIKNAKARLNLSGLLDLTPENPSFNLDVVAEKIPLPWLPFPPSVKINSGYIDTRFICKGLIGTDLTVAGNIKIPSADFIVSSGEKKWDSTLQDLALEFDSNLNRHGIVFRSLKLIKDDTAISAGLSLYFQEKKNPDIWLDLKSNTLKLGFFKTLCPVPLFSPWIDKKLYPILQAGDLKINQFVLKGKYDQFREIERRQNHSIIKFDLECKNFALKGGTPEHPFKNVSASVTMDKGELSILNFQGNFGQSTITKGNLTIPNVFMPNPSFNSQLLGRFHFSDLLAQSKMKLFSDGSSAWFSHLDMIEGVTDCQVDILYKSDWKTPRIVKGQFDLKDCLVSHEGQTRPIQISQAMIKLDSQAGNRFEGVGHWGNSPLRAQGIYYINNGDITLGETEVIGYADVEELFSSYYPQGNASFSFSRPLPFNLRLVEQPGYYSCQGAIKLEEVALSARHFNINPSMDQGRLNFDFDYWPGRRINIKKAVYELADSEIELTGYYSLSQAENYSGHIQTKGFSLEPLGLYWESNKRKFNGKLAAELKIEGLRNNPSQTTLRGKIEGVNISCGFKPAPAALDQCHFLFRFEEKEIIIDKLTMRFGNSPIRVRGKVKGWTQWKANLDVDSTFLNLSTLLPELDSMTPESFTISEGKNIRLKLALNCPEGVWRQLKLGPLNARMEYGQGVLELKTMLLNLEYGTIKTSGRVTGGEAGGIFLAGNVELKEQPLGDVFQSLNIGKGSIKGPLSLNMDFQMKGKKFKDLVPGLNGKASVRLGKGLIKDAPVFIEVLDLLSVQNIYKQRPPDLREEGFYFESMSGDAIIQNGVLKSENFIMRSPVFNAVGYGEIDLGAKTTNFILGTQPHNTIDTLISNIPVFGYIITGENKAFLTYYFKVTGSIKDPDVKLIPLESLGKGVTGIIKRLLLTPLNLFN